MDLSEIETFLTIVNTKSITKTADILFLSQPTVSHRLKSLEKELGFPLIVRKKGFKNVELTSKGSEFVSIAERYISCLLYTSIVKFTDEREITSARLHLVAQNLRTLYFLIRYSGGGCQFDIIFL